MDARVASRAERLARATALVQRAAAQDAHLAVLPELFNLGYGYSAENIARAEPPDGPTAAWLRDASRTYGLHLAGSWLVRAADGHIYSRVHLVAPDGRVWTYDKVYPWGWERAYFRGSRRGPVVADTDLGRIGFLVCWDAAHRGLWRAYAGRVDLMVLVTSPPDIPAARVTVPGHRAVPIAGLGPWAAGLRTAGPRLFHTQVAEQVAWLGVPAVQSGVSGVLDTAIPRPRATLLAHAPLAPRLLALWPRAAQARLRGAFVPAARVLDVNGEVRAAPPPAGDAVAVAAVPRGRARPPRGRQPPRRLPWVAYAVSDGLLPALMRGLYQRARHG